MKAVIWNRYGAPDRLRLGEVERPTVGEDDVLIKVHASSVNRTDAAMIRAKPFFMRLLTGIFTPRKHITGTEFSGEIEAVGHHIVSFSKGDRVFGFADLGAQAHAQYLAIDAKHVVTMPEGLSFTQAAPSFEGAHYAYNFINKVALKAGQEVLVNGATGAIGSAAVQLLKTFDVTVTAVCGTDNIERVRSLGADRVIDYTKEDFTKGSGQYDYVFDTVGKSSFFKCFNVLKRDGIYISSDLGYLSQNIFLPLITPLLKPLLGNKKSIFPVPVELRTSLLLVKELIEAGKFKALIDREYPLERIVEAFQYVERGEKIGNVVITVPHDKTPKEHV